MSTYTIKGGDTFAAIAAQFNLSVEAIQSANPGVKPTELQVGQVINLSVSNDYTIKPGDTLYGISKSLNIDVGVISSLNPGVDPTKLEVGQVIKVPVSGTNQPPPPPPPQVIQPPPPPPQIVQPPPPPPQIVQPPTPPQSTSGKYTIVGGDTFTVIASRHNTDAAAIQNLNPGINPNTLQIGQVINVPNNAGSLPTPVNGTGLIHYSGPASAFPSPQLWASYDRLWAHNSNLMKYSNTDSEIAILGNVIPQVAQETGVDARVILCMCMQETGGSVHAPITFSPAPDFVRNTGIMQAHNGAVFDAANPVGSITQMVRDGAGGTANGDGLKQCLQKFGGNYYEALRAYNSGSVDRSDLSNGITATGHYVSRMANRLVGNVWENM